VVGEEADDSGVMIAASRATCNFWNTEDTDCRDGQGERVTGRRLQKIVSH
jgi:hypothetical protein